MSRVWTDITSEFGSRTPIDVAYGGGKYVVIFNDSNDVAVADSPAGPWSFNTIPGAAAGWERVEWLDDRFMVVAPTGSAFATDGAAWARFNGPSGGSGFGIYALARYGTRFYGARNGRMEGGQYETGTFKWDNENLSVPWNPWLGYAVLAMAPQSDGDNLILARDDADGGISALDLPGETAISDVLAGALAHLVRLADNSFIAFGKSGTSTVAVSANGMTGWAAGSPPLGTFGSLPNKSRLTAEGAVIATTAGLEYTADGLSWGLEAGPPGATIDGDYVLGLAGPSLDSLLLISDTSVFYSQGEALPPTYIAPAGPHLRKLPVVTVIPGDPGQPARPASTTCLPPPPPDNSGSPVPVGTGAGGEVIYLHVPNDPNNAAAGETMVDSVAPAPVGYTCGYTTWLVPDPSFPGGYIPVIGTHCFWNYP